MGSVLSGEYDFTAARSRIMLLTMMYRKAKHQEDEMACWELMAQIEELEKEVAEAHESNKYRMTTVQGGHPLTSFENIITLIVPQWRAEGKEETRI
jgi:hypothetical protein